VKLCDWACGDPCFEGTAAQHIRNHMPNDTKSYYSRFEANEINIFFAISKKEARLTPTPLCIHVK